jgi:mono/diheme cytochrome c family protein
MMGRTWMIVLCVAAMFIGMGLAGCVPPSATPSPSDLTGTAAAGQTTFDQKCAGCHSASILHGRANKIVNNMVSISFGMAGLTLTDQEVADLQAYAATQ